MNTEPDDLNTPTDKLGLPNNSKSKKKTSQIDQGFAAIN